MYLKRLQFDGQLAMVIGAGGGGMGTATTHALLEAGATVVALDHSPQQLADLEASAGPTGKCLTAVVDVLDHDALVRVIAGVVADHGPVSALVNVVGGTQKGQYHPLDRLPDAAFDAVVAFNLSWVVTACREVARGMIDNGVAGAIVNFASVSGMSGAPYHGAYGAAKAGVIALTKTMAVEWGRYGIRVNAVSPGSIATPRSSAVTTENGDQSDENGPPGPFWDNVRRVTPLGRPGRPDDVAGPVLFLLSDLARLISGQTLVVDGGMTARNPVAEASLFEALVMT